jgi:predicted nucleotidyltransferase
MRYQKEIKKIVDQIVRNYKPERIILFGSFACGKIKENSDVDLAVIKKTKERFTTRLLKVAGMIKSSLGTDILVYTPKEWNETLKRRKLFYKRNYPER